MADLETLQKELALFQFEELKRDDIEHKFALGIMAELATLKKDIEDRVKKLESARLVQIELNKRIPDVQVAKQSEKQPEPLLKINLWKNIFRR